MKGWKHIPIEEFAKAEVGAENCVIATDLGQYMNPILADGMKEFILALMSKGINQEQINWMAKKNPPQLLGL